MEIFQWNLAMRNYKVLESYNSVIFNNFCESMQNRYVCQFIVSNAAYIINHINSIL